MKLPLTSRRQPNDSIGVFDATGDFVAEFVEQSNVDLFIAAINNESKANALLARVLPTYLNYVRQSSLMVDIERHLENLK